MKALRIMTVAAATLLLAGCSTTRVLPEGSYRLASNKIHITEPEGVTTSDVNSYIKQKPNTYFILGWNPFLNIYNWSDGTGKGLDKVWTKIGTAPVVYSPDSVAESTENIRDHLDYLGYYDSEVSARVDTVRRLVNVHYDVKPGKRYPIDSIEFVLPEGNAEFRGEFLEDMPNVGVRRGDFLSESKLEAESSRSAKHFNNLGYYDFNKNNYFFEVDTLGGRALLKYEIREYNRNENPSDAAPIQKYRFGKVQITRSANINFRDDVIKRLNTIHPGDLYNENIVNTTYSRLSALKLFNGVGVNMTPTDSATIDCNIRMSESTVTGFKANLELSTNSVGLMGINPNVSWYHKNIFHGAEWLTVDFSSNFQFNPKTDVKATELTFSSSLSFPRFLGLPENLYKGSDIPRTEIKASFSYQDRPEYKRNIASLTYGYSGSGSGKFSYQLYPFRTSVVKVYNLSDSFIEYLFNNTSLTDMFSDHIDMGVSGMLYWTTNSDIVPKTPYSYARLSADVSGNLLKLAKVKQLFGLSYSNYVRGEATLGHTFRFGYEDNQALALRFVAGAGIGLEEESNYLPYERMFFVGGASSMRGWQSRTLGPGFFNQDDYADTFLIPSQMGDMKLEFDMEYRFKLFWKLEGALFAEVGNVWNLDKTVFEVIELPDGDYDVIELPDPDNFRFSDFHKSLAADWGFGVRVNLDFILLRLDMGLKVRDPSRAEGQRWVGPDQWFKQNGFAIHFGVGYPF